MADVRSTLPVEPLAKPSDTVTLRDHFAGQALVAFGMRMNELRPDRWEMLAQECFDIADLMVAIGGLPTRKKPV